MKYFLFVCCFFIAQAFWVYGAEATTGEKHSVLPPLVGANGHSATTGGTHSVLRPPLRANGRDVSTGGTHSVLQPPLGAYFPDYYQIMNWIPHPDHPDLVVTKATSREDMVHALLLKRLLSDRDILSALFLVRKEEPQIFNQVFLSLLEEDLWLGEIKKGMNILKDPVLRFQYEVMSEAWNPKQSVFARQKSLSRLPGYREMIPKQWTADLSSDELERFRYLAPETEKWLRDMIANPFDYPLVRAQATRAFKHSSWPNKEETGRFFFKTIFAVMEETDLSRRALNQTGTGQAEPSGQVLPAPRGLPFEKGAVFGLLSSHKENVRHAFSHKISINRLQTALLEQLRSPSLEDFMKTEVAQNALRSIAGHMDLSPLVRAHAFWTWEVSAPHFVKEDLELLRAKVMDNFNKREKSVFVRELSRLQALHAGHKKTCAGVFQTES